MSRALIVAIVIVTAACGTRRSPAPPATSRAAPVAPNPSQSPLTPGAPTPRTRMLDTATRRQVIALVREGRRAARAEQWPVALAAFDRALAIESRAPRLLCEAGFVAHRAGKNTIAMRRIDLALALFPATHALPAELVRPVAMCLYNRGLVAVARGDHDDARSAFEASARLRPNPEVQRRLEALDAVVRGEDVDRRDSMIANVRISRDAEPPTWLANDDAAIEGALARSFSGRNDFNPVEGLVRATITRRERVSLDWTTSGIREVLLYLADDHSTPLGGTYLAIGFRRSNGVAFVASVLGGYDNTDHGVWSGGDLAHLRITRGPVLRVDYDDCGSSGSQQPYDWDEHPDYECFEDVTSDDGCTSVAILCAPGDAAHVRCAKVDAAFRVGTGSRTEYSCTDENGEEVAGPDGHHTAPDTSRNYRLDLSGSAGAITIRAAEGAPPAHLAALVGTRPLDALAASSPIDVSALRSESDLREDLDAYVGEMGD